MSLGTIRLRAVTGGVALETVGYLEKPAFGAYLGACKSAKGRYEASVNAQVCPIDRLHDALAALQRAGFAVDLDASLGESLRAVAQDAQAEVVAMSEAMAAALARVAAAGQKLYPFQEDGVRWLAAAGDCLLADEMRLGKTLQVLAALPAGRGAVVVCPGVVKGNWLRECRLWRPDLQPVILSGRDSFRWPEQSLLGPELIITNYQILPQSRDCVIELARKRGKCGKKQRPGDDDLKAMCPGERWYTEAAPEGCTLIADEAHALKAGNKTQQGRRFRGLSKLVRAASGTRKLLTGTPLVNRPPELWNVLEAADLGAIAYGGWDGLVYAFNGTKLKYGMEWGTPRPEAAIGLQKVMLRRLRRDVIADLPAKTYQEILVELDAKLGKKLTAIMETVEAALGKSMATATLADLLKPMAFRYFSEISTALATAKLPAALEIVQEFEESEQPLVVFSMHRACVDVIGARPGWGKITGDETPAEKDAVQQAFQRGDLIGVAVTIKAGGIGIKLSRASCALMIDKAWTMADNEQAEDRLVDIVTKNAVTIISLVSEHPMDQRISVLLEVKRENIAASVDASAAAPQRRSEDLIAERQQIADMVAGAVTLSAAKARGESNIPLAAVTKPEKPLTNPAENKRFVEHIPAGRYCLPDGPGGLLFLEISKGTGKWEDWCFVSRLTGAPGSFRAEKVGSVKPDGWSANILAPNLLRCIAADPREAAARFGREVGECSCCGSPLTNAESRKLGIGPVCAAKFGA